MADNNKAPPPSSDNIPSPASSPANPSATSPSNITPNQAAPALGGPQGSTSTSYNGGSGSQDAAKATVADAKKAADAAAKAKQNPALRAMGLPNFRAKLPSRNWLIFWTVIGSWTGAWAYDRRQKRLTQEKWAKVVSHIARQPLAADELPRKLTVYLTSAPNDFILTTREHFHEYVRPILAKSGLDWDAVEGRKEGDVRAQVAEKVRRRRKLSGEQGGDDMIKDDDLELQIEEIRQRMSVRQSAEVGGDLIIGRNTWKEYIRGLHEGWLGPLDAPKIEEEVPVDSIPSEESATSTKPDIAVPKDLSTVPVHAAENLVTKVAQSTLAAKLQPETPIEPKTIIEDSHPTKVDEAGNEAKAPETSETPPATPEDPEAAKKKKAKKQPPPFNSTTDYASASLPASIPEELTPSTVIPFPHILGFRNTPVRMYRFLNQRHLAEDVGRQVAAAVLASYRPYAQVETTQDDEDTNTSSANDDTGSSASQSSMQWEQAGIMRKEESEWHKSLRKERVAEKESVWLDRSVFDERIAARMRRFVLNEREEERAGRIASGVEGILGERTDED